MVKSKTKSISNLGTFSNFSKTERSIYNFLKIPAWNWRGSYLFCYGAWAQKESAKLQNMRACTGITGLSVWNLSDSSKSLDDRQIKGTCRCRQSRFLFPDSSRKDRSDSASRVTIIKRNKTLTIVIPVKIDIIISFPTIFQTLTNVHKRFTIAVAKRSAITPKEATTVHVRQASLEMAKTAQVLAFYSH